MQPAKEFSAEIDAVWQTAYHSDKGGGEDWKKLLVEYEAVPLSDEEKEKLSTGEMKITKGAYPIELRRVYEKICSKYFAQSALLTGSEKDDLVSALNSFNTDKKVLEYYLKIKPFSGIGDIFKNSAIGTQKYSAGLKGEKQFTIKCKNCGAPRLEEDQKNECAFCGSKLFENAK